MVTTDPKPITQAEHIQAEVGYPLRRLDESNRTAAATSAATLLGELHRLARELDPGEDTRPRIATHNGKYYRWEFLDRWRFLDQ